MCFVNNSTGRGLKAKCVFHIFTCLPLLALTQVTAQKQHTSEWKAILLEKAQHHHHHLAHTSILLSAARQILYSTYYSLMKRMGTSPHSHTLSGMFFVI